MKKVSIITSVYNCEEYMEYFLENIIKQTIFKECELIIINAASQQNEDSIIKNYCKRFDNIKYTKLNADPGLYAVWNLCIENSSARYITNANTDDCKADWCLEEQCLTLDQNPSIDLVYGETLETHNELETFNNNSHYRIFPCYEFSLESLLQNNSPHSSPMWRRSMHEKYGHFDPSYKYCGDYEMWVRAARQKSIFKKINCPLSLYYRNKKGLSTKKENIKPAIKEIERIKNTKIEN